MAKYLIAVFLFLSPASLLAADIIETVFLAKTFESLGLLGILVVIRTFLSFSLEVELTGRLPWRAGDGASASS